MTLLELINQQIDITPHTRAIKSLKENALIEASDTFKQALDAKIINKWIEDGLLEYSRTSKNRLTKILDIIEVSEVDRVVLLHRYEERKGKLAVELNNASKLPFRVETITCTASDGQTLKGTLVWNSKDYNVYIQEPFEGICGGAHLMYAFPVVYVLDDDEKREGVKCIPLLESAKEALIEKYEKGKI